MKVFPFVVAAVILSCSVVFGQEPPPAMVKVTKIIHEEVSENRSFLGLLYYDRISLVSSEVSGLVDVVHVEAGDRIDKGTPLVSLDTEMLDQETALAKIRIEQVGLRIQHAKKDYERLEKLFAKDGVSEKNYEDALYAYQDYLKEKQLAEQSLEKLLIQKRKSLISAPFAGIVLEKSVDTGSWVQQGRQLISLGAADELRIRLPIAETLLQFVTMGEKVPVEITAFHKKLTGRIDDIDPTADPKTKNVYLKISIPTLPLAAQNMSAEVFIPTSTKKKLAIIPRDGLVKFQGKDFVYTVKDGKASILPVNIVTYLGDKVGADNPYLVPGLEIVVEGNERLRPDQAVMVAGEK